VTKNKTDSNTFITPPRALGNLKLHFAMKL
jgi:hypothetical protein